MKSTGSLLLLLSCGILSACSSSSSQDTAAEPALAETAAAFLHTLGEEQLKKAFFPFDSAERFNWHFVPLTGKRKGIPVEELDSAQQQAAFGLLKFTLSEQGYRKAKGIMELESILKELENRAPEDDYRDPGKYYFSIFGEPSAEEPWGWRLEGHHLSINYTSVDNRLVSATPEFMGANPAVVPSGPHKGLQLLKNETELAFQLLHSLSEEQLGKTLIGEEAPADIITGNARKAMMDRPAGIPFSELDKRQKAFFINLLDTYIGNFRKEFSDRMMKRLEGAGMDSLHFAWAGSVQPGPGNAHYYRIHGPVLLIEYDNTQNDANHVHTVVRDLTNDFGEDALKRHYEQGHSHTHSEGGTHSH
ncbi:MAG TPA: DUF3500 domain-containing protein [Anseongella sp.]|nr:DUF3500 domain-containing protein [Anseongella sp.]